MRHSESIVLGVMLLGTLALAACGETKSQHSEITACENVAKALLQNPQTFEVAESSIEETSEGDSVLIEVDYQGAQGSGHMSDKCWFAGYGQNKTLTRFSYRTDLNGDFVELQDEELKALLQQVQG